MEVILPKSCKHSRVWSPLDDDCELPGKPYIILLGNRGDSSKPPSITNTAKPTRPAWPVWLRGFDSLVALGSSLRVSLAGGAGVGFARICGAGTAGMLGVGTVSLAGGGDIYVGFG